MRIIFFVVILILLSVFLVHTKSSLAAVDISIDTSTVGSDFKNISGGANTDSATQEDLNKFITQVGANLFRIKTWTWRINESLSNYFKTTDGVDYIGELKAGVDTVHSGGGKVIMQFYGMPQWLSNCTGASCNSVLSNAIPEYSKYPPTDYVRWQELVSGMIKKLQDNGVQIDYFEIYGEPNFGSTWWGQGGISARPSFYEHYRQTDQAIRKILPTAKVGGSAFGSVSTLLDLNSTSKYSQWIKGFVDFVKTNNLSLAFFSWHLYSPRTDIFKQDAETLRNYLDSQGLSSVPLFLTEWGVDGGANLRQKANTHFGASFTAAALMDISHSASDAQTFYSLAGDSFGLIKKDHQIKPAFNAFQLYSMLQGKELTVNSTEPEYSLAFSNTSIKQKDIRSVAVKNNNEISVLTTYYLPIAPEKDPNFSLTKNINLAITKIPFSKYSYKIYLIDQNHSNGYAGGNPELAITEQGEGSGDFKKAITLPIYGTVMVKLTAVVDNNIPVPITQKINLALSKKLAGRILLQVESHGEAWYVNPLTFKRHYMGRPQDAFNLMRQLGLGAKHDFIINTQIFPDRLLGRILLDVEQQGQAYYINPVDKKKYYLGRPDDAFRIMREQGLGINDSDLEQIEEA